MIPSHQFNNLSDAMMTAIDHALPKRVQGLIVGEHIPGEVDSFHADEVDELRQVLADLADVLTDRADDLDAANSPESRRERAQDR